MTKEQVIKLILLLRPKYYNRFTWLVVLAGISLVTPSIFENILNEFLKTKFHFNIISEQDGLYGITLIIGGLIYNGWVHYLELKRENVWENTKREENIKNTIHDSKIFETSDNILNEEELNTILNQLYNHEINLDNIKKIWAYNNYYKLNSNKFLNKELSAKNEAFSENLKELSTFLATKFFPAKHSEAIFEMLPEQNWDKTTLGVTEEGEKRYTKFTHDLNELLKRVDQTYREYRETIKKILKV